MKADSEISNVIGRAVYADGGKVSIGGKIINIKADEDMWEKSNGTVLHLRNSAIAEFSGIAEQCSGGVLVITDKATFDMKQGALLGNSDDAAGVKTNEDPDWSKVDKADYGINRNIITINGEITGIKNSKNPIQFKYGTLTIGESGYIHDNAVNYGALYIQRDAAVHIHGKINNNVSTGRGGALGTPGHGFVTLYMYPGAEIKNNTAAKTGGGASLNNCKFTMYGGEISGNTGKTGGGIYLYSDASADILGGTITNNTADIGSNDLAVTSKNCGTDSIYLYISDKAQIGNPAVYMEENTKTVSPGDRNIKLHNASTDSVKALTEASKAKGWSAPLATFWTQRDGAANLTVGGLTLNDLPVYVLSLPVDKTGNIPAASKVQVYEAQKTDTGDIDITLPDVSENGYAVAVVQPSQNHGTLIINGPKTIERNKTGTPYPVTYTVTYAMSESMEGIIKQSVGKAKYVLTIDHDTRLVLVGNPDSFNGKSIQVTYNLPHSEFRVGDVLLASAKLTITVGGYDYIVPSKVTKTQEVETTYSLTTQVNGGHGGISASKAGLPAGSHETVVFTPDSGYKIDTVTVNGVKAEVRSNKLEVIMDADKTVIVTYKSIPHTHNHGTAWKSGKTASSNTGDSSNPVLWSALLFISGGAVIGTTVVSRKKKYNR